VTAQFYTPLNIMPILPERIAATIVAQGLKEEICQKEI
jgi:hypothetical protein